MTHPRHQIAQARPRLGGERVAGVAQVVQVELGTPTSPHASRHLAAALKLLRRHGCPCSVGKTSPSAPGDEYTSK